MHILVHIYMSHIYVSYVMLNNIFIHLGIISLASRGVTNLLVFFCTGKNRMVKIMRSSFEMVLRTTKHTMIYPALVSSL
jgi:hypothetical protein